jgi:hypothetical protein
MRTLRLALMALSASIFAAACAAGVSSDYDFGPDGEGGEGGEGGGNSSGGGGAGPADSGPPDVQIECMSAGDCGAFNGVCSVGQCVNGLCQNAPANEFGSCDDGLFCTVDDICVNGACLGGASKFCASLDNCHIGVCDEDLKTCKNIAGNEGQPCDDLNPCTYAGVCNSGVCSQGKQIDCTVFDSACTKGVCDQTMGCKPIPFNEGVACNDQLHCTINDKCSNGACVGAPNTCGDPEDVCMIGSCDEATDKCIAVPGNNGAACDDKNLCTAGETCSSGKCVGGQPANDGAACDDADGCTSGTSCAGGTCTNATATVVQCTTGDQCCPPGCQATDNDCLFWEPGILQNVNATSLTGWSLCWSGPFDQSQPSVASILQQCDKNKLLLACRPSGSQTYTLAAMAPRADVLFDCGQQPNCTKIANGVGWYFSDNYSWGFAPQGELVERNSCDVGQSLPDLRMCWHTSGGNINSGYRCGTNILNGDPTWERAVFEAD